MSYIVLDLEWNQAVDKEKSEPALPFEIIEIGALKLDEDGREEGRFSCLIRPVVYPELFYRVKEVVGITSRELERDGVSFSDAIEVFWRWCGDDPVFFTWGDMDLTELQRNIVYFKAANPLPFPLFFYDVQKLYSLQFSDGRERAALDAAAHQLKLPTDQAFHRAVNDADYTAQVLRRLDARRWKQMISVDYFRPPLSQNEEIYLVFDRYSKFVSMPYPTREEAMQVHNVTSTVCFKCGHNAARKLNWFTDSSRKYFCVAYCPVHGWIKGKIRVKHYGDQVFCVKTIKLTDAEGAKKIRLKAEHVRKKRYEKTAGEKAEEWKPERRKIRR